ncbi:hypothetical protein DFH09DRAFT_1095199 [Mycena vulgaris]|nr:hypothetical protein DFH09DRAFT_1095199 [Mycena vulgaris]
MAHDSISMPRAVTPSESTPQSQYSAHGPRKTQMSRWRLEADHPSDALLDFNTPILAMVWFEDELKPAQIVVYPHEDLRVRLCDHKIALAAVGFAKGTDGIQVYVQNGGEAAWRDCNWDTPLRVYAAGDAILLSYTRVSILRDFKIHEPHLI